MTTLVSMPTEIVDYLRETIEQSSGNKEANFAVYRFGSEWGKAIVQASGERCKRDELTQKAALTAVHTGVTNMDVTLSDEYIAVKPYDNTIGNMYFLAGYVSGTISELLQQEHIARIKDDHFEVVPVKEKIAKEVSAQAPAKKEIDLGRLKRGGSYMVMDDTKGSLSFEIFFKAVEKGAPGLCFTRVFPPKIREQVSKEFPIFWLSTVDGSDDINSIKPDSYDNEMIKIIKGYLSAKRSIFVIHGIEYLITNNEFEPIFKFVQDVKEITADNKGIFLLSVDTKAMESQHLDKLKTELDIFDI